MSRDDPARPSRKAAHCCHDDDIDPGRCDEWCEPVRDGVPHQHGQSIRLSAAPPPAPPRPSPALVARIKRILRPYLP